MAKKKKSSKKAKAEAKNEALNDPPKEKKRRESGGVLLTLLKVLFALLAVAELALLVFIGVRYVGSSIASPALPEVTDPGTGTVQTVSSSSYIGPGLYIKDGEVIYDYTGVTGRIKTAVQDGAEG